MLSKHVTNCRNYNSPFWRSAIATPVRRCLVPFSKFAEPKSGKDESGKPANYWLSLPAASEGHAGGIGPERLKPLIGWARRGCSLSSSAVSVAVDEPAMTLVFGLWRLIDFDPPRKSQRT